MDSENNNNTLFEHLSEPSDCISNRVYGECINLYRSDSFVFKFEKYLKFRSEFVKHMKYFYPVFDSKIMQCLLEEEFEKIRFNITTAVPTQKSSLLNYSLFIAGGFAAYINGDTTKFNDIDIFMIHHPRTELDERYWYCQRESYSHFPGDKGFGYVVYNIRKNNDYIAYITKKFEIKHFPQVIFFNFWKREPLKIIRILNSFDLPICRIGFHLLEPKFRYHSLCAIVEYEKFDDVYFSTISIQTGRYLEFCFRRLIKYRSRSALGATKLKYTVPTLKSIIYREICSLNYSIYPFEVCMCEPTKFFNYFLKQKSLKRKNFPL